MARRVLETLVVVGVLVGVPVWLGAQAGKSPVEGAWVLQDFSYAKTPAPVRLNKPIGMMLFTGNHYAVVMLRDSGPRPEVGVGTFEISGNTLTTRAQVAKGITPMAKGSFLEETFTLKGDTLTMTSSRSNTGPSQNPRTYRVVRAK